jgi:magnesium-transporting ATPase (P-type)
LKHFIWPNGNKYYAPPVEFLDSYNSEKDEVSPTAMAWFGYPSQKVRTRMKDNTVVILNFYPILSVIINAVMLFMVLFYCTLKGWRGMPQTSKGILMGITVWFLNAGFTIGASSAALRFQSFPILLTTTFVALLVDWLWKMAMTTEAPKLQPDVKEVKTDLAMNVQ